MIDSVGGENVKINGFTDKCVDVKINNSTISVLPLRSENSFVYIAMEYKEFIKNISTFNDSDGKFFVYVDITMVLIITDNIYFVSAVNKYNQKQLKNRALESVFMKHEHGENELLYITDKYPTYNNEELVYIKGSDSLVLDSYITKLITDDEYICTVFYVNKEETLNKFMHYFYTVNAVFDGFIVKLYEKF